MNSVKRIAVIGTGPAGVITIDALAKEESFDVIRVFERREGPGGCWLEDTKSHPALRNFSSLASRNGDPPVRLPPSFPANTPQVSQQRFAESSVYPYLETNVDAVTMSFSDAPIPTELSPLTISKHGEDSPFRHHVIIRKYVESLLNRNGYEKLVSYNTTVERAEKVENQWKLVLRERDGSQDSWWIEWFDAVVVASGHFNVPYIPSIQGLEELETSKPGSVQHSKMFRGRDAYKDKRVVVVGASVSAADIAVDLIGVAKAPVYAVIKGHKANVYFGDVAFQHPAMLPKPSISRIETQHGVRTVHFVDGTSVSDVDHIIFGTGYSWSLPFLPQIVIRNNRIPGLYQHVVYQKDPTLLFVGAVGAGLTFKIFEWQAVLAARVLSGRASLPSLSEQQEWEEDRIAQKGDSAAFAMVYPDFEEYFETVRRIGGEPTHDGKGRKLQEWNQEWFDLFMQGHERRKKWWREQNAKGREGHALQERL